MDRCQSQWVRKYWIEDGADEGRTVKKGLFIAVGATHGKKLFDGAVLTMRYFFDALDTELWESLLFRGIDFEGDVLKYPDYLQQAYETGRRMAAEIGPKPDR
jgi:hypothetical protein